MDNTTHSEYRGILSAIYQSDNSFKSKLITTIFIYLIVQAILGIVAIEYAWCRTRRFREKNSERDEQFPCFRRYDAQYWARWKFYPGAMLLMPTRIVLLVFDGIFLTSMVSLLSIGHDYKKGPMEKGCRKWLIYFLYHVCCSFYLFVCGMTTQTQLVDVDYSYYLGEDYKSAESSYKRVSTIVSNHCSWLDPVVLIKTLRPAFAPSSEFENVPLLGTLCKALDSIFIPRGGSEEKKALVLQAIRDRQVLTEKTGKYNPFLIFPEGATTNGTGIFKFKKGAFFAEKTLRPIFMQYSQGTVSPAFDIMEFLPLAILQLSWAGLSVKVNVLPDFTPNEYLFENHAEKGAERWEIYAWAIRDIMCKTGKFQEIDTPVRTKFLYEAHMQLKKGAECPGMDKKFRGAESLSLSDLDSPSLDVNTPLIQKS